MALKDIWKDLVDGVSEIDVDDINNIAGAVIDIEENGGGGSADLSNYYTKQEVEQKIDEVSDIADEAKSDSSQAILTSENADYTSRQAEGNARNALNLSKQALNTALNSNTLADNAIEIAQSVRADADSGKFDGEKGEKGDKGDKGEQGIQGIQGEKGDDGKDGADYIITEADKEEIKSDVVETLTRSSTALPEMLDVNTIYDLGEQDALTLNLPAGKLGDFIEVDFLSTQTPTTLTITASSGMSDYELIPDANTIYSLYFNWIRLDAENYGWGFGYAEYTRTVLE